MPAYGNFIRDKGYDAEAVVVKYRAVKAGAGAEAAIQCSVLGEGGIGVAQFDVVTADLTRGKGVTVREDGTTEWEVAAANAGVIARGADVTVAADGRVQAAAATHRIWGTARQASSAAGQRIAVDLAVVKSIKA